MMQQPKDNEDHNNNNRITWGDGYDLKFEIVKSILYRETKLENLRVLTRPYRSTGMTSKMKKKARALIEEVRDATVDVVEKIMYWSLRFVKKTSFVWHSQNYLLLVLNSMNFLDRFLVDERKFERNPLVRTHSRLRGEDPIDTSSTDEKKMEDKLDLCELLLVEEENLCEPIPDRFRCDWCGRVEESSQVVCFRRDCRSRFCDRCIDANSKLAGSYEKASRAKSWKCFLCVEKIKQVSRTATTTTTKTTRRRVSNIGRRIVSSRPETSKTVVTKEIKSTSSIMMTKSQSTPKSALKVWKRRMRATKQAAPTVTNDNALDLLLSEHDD